MRLTLIACALTGLSALIIGVLLFGTNASSKYVDNAYGVALTASQSAARGADSRGFSGSVLEIYHSLSEEQQRSITRGAF